ncbi:hypothetical protein [Streptomyces sp. NPDC058674]|uniref:hypothetical protein n=1 Tax=Streptomyces sp. NPDC058674 TaxID=3346592 RepID=UPI00365AF504
MLVLFDEPPPRRVDDARIGELLDRCRPLSLGADDRPRGRRPQAVVYIVDLNPAGIGTVVAVSVSGDDTYSYGTALGPLASRLFAQSEHR